MALIACLFIAQAYTQNALNYDWKSVKIGGGYITGVKVHPQDPDIMYLRTDVGGAYKSTKSYFWIIAWAYRDFGNIQKVSMEKVTLIPVR